MLLHKAQIEQYEEDGYLLLENVFTEREVHVMRQAVTAVLTDQQNNVVFESRSDAPRHAMGCHQHNEIFRLLVNDGRIVEPTQQILSEKVYVHQFKINPKVAFDGEPVFWHQDFSVWNRDDGMPEPRAINMAVLLDDVTNINGPLLLVPGSHKLKTFFASADQNAYELPRELAADIIKRHGIVSAEGPAGSVVLFHSNIVHGSGGNISPFPRRVAFISYCAISNFIRNPTRPDWLAHRDFTAVSALASEIT